jgi:hypothetical protein
VDPALEREARRLVTRYQIEVVERFGLCPWAEPARARGEVRVDVVDPADAGAALDRFAADTSVVIGLVVMPGFAGDAAALRRLRDDLLAGPRADVIALADFHPDAALDASSAGRVVPWLRRAPDPMLQAVRHRSLASLRRGGDVMVAVDQVATLAGWPVPPRVDPAVAVAAANLDTVRAEVDAVSGVLDDIARDRDASYARLATAGVAIRTRR